MRNILLVCTLLITVFLSGTSSVCADTVVRSGESVDLKADQHVDGNFYILSGESSLSGSVNGDVTGVAGSVTVNGPIAHDLLLVSTNVGVYASVTEDVRIVAGTVTLANEVKGSVFVLGGELKILSTAKIDGDVFFIGGSLESDGQIGGALLGTADLVRVDGEVGKGIDVAATTLSAGDHARIKGGVRLRSINDFERAPGAVIEGEVTKTIPQTPGATAGTTFKALALAFATSLFASLVLYLIARRFITRLVDFIVEHLGQSLVAGLGSLPALLFLALVCFGTGLGIFLGIMILSFTVGSILATLPLLNILTGTIAAKIVTDKTVINSFTIAGGALLVQLFLYIPVLGFIIVAILFILAFGGLILALHRVVKRLA